MRVFKQKEALISQLSAEKNNHKTIGLVPTMGALHKGHLSLVSRALEENDLVVVSIFVNPTQFNNPEDLAKYPKTLDKDVGLLEELNDQIIIFAPSAEEMYQDDITSEKFDFDGLEFQMEGKFRPGHFDGVGTIVKKLFNTVTPDRAYFGEKDYQQLQIIKKLTEKEQLDVQIIECPITRESSGLAMSSRNERLPKDLRNKAAFIYKTISKAKEKFSTQSIQQTLDWINDQFVNHEDFELEYVEIADQKTLKSVKVKKNGEHYRLFVAVYANDIRLIDTIALN
ncbi:pantoate-beta-alanine ligase [Galbibacter marinus]|uniref:Pantothenate synthetase n=1 Tax=Galbibacter marinus TaxID=555500 RepID=K2P355_9FLAO|nr:pantoate--beta-alanine ligase [Galbibacter marinus]EKF55478.1 pantoate-beta-alanine ligase [Galbibacter marinus]